MPQLDEASGLTAFNRVVSDDQTKLINGPIGGCETSASSGYLQQEAQVFELAMAQGQTFAFASGDSGSEGGCVEEPASSPFAVAVGGTTLSTTGGATWTGETAWSGSGGGPSSLQPMPSWQQNVGQNAGHSTRGVPDPAYDGNPNTGALVCEGGSTFVQAGTGLSAPLFVGMWARVLAADAIFADGVDGNDGCAAN